MLPTWIFEIKIFSNLLLSVTNNMKRTYLSMNFGQSNHLLGRWMGAWVYMNCLSRKCCSNFQIVKIFSCQNYTILFAVHWLRYFVYIIETYWDGQSIIVSSKESHCVQAHALTRYCNTHLSLLSHASAWHFASKSFQLLSATCRSHTTKTTYFPDAHLLMC